jgi:hypothetical protein
MHGYSRARSTSDVRNFAQMAETWLQLTTTTLSLTQKADLDRNAPTTDKLQ